MKKKQKGFTLVELLVVISIIGFLSSIVLASLGTARAKARDTQRISDMHQLQTALELYRNAHNSYPVCNSNWCGGCDSNNFGGVLNDLVTEGYLSKLPVDPLSNKKTGCFNYEYGGPNEAVYTCDGLNSNNYAYLIRFETEKTILNWPKFTLYGTPITDRGGNEYCLVMNK